MVKTRGDRTRQKKLAGVTASVNKRRMEPGQVSGVQAKNGRRSNFGAPELEIALRSHAAD
ncbi:MAG TPA: hypothetical protein VHY08_03220 [Bacillota bacterium]|nr:hypothetical protein [Bacillota bacterium]